MAQGFSATVSAWVAEKPKRAEAVFKTAVQRTIEDAQTPVSAGGNLPVDTGFLRASLVVSLGSDIPVGRLKPDGVEAFSYSGTEVNLTINGATLDTPITAAWTANYARHVNDGANGRPARKFRDLAAQRWPQQVALAARDAEAAVAARNRG